MKKFKVLVRSPNSQTVLKEFKNSDKQTVMEMGDDFSISFEFELEYSGPQHGERGERERRNPCDDENEREYQTEQGLEQFDNEVLSEEKILEIMEEIVKISPPGSQGNSSAFGHDELELLKFAIDNLFSKVDWRSESAKIAAQRNSPYYQGTLELREGKVLDYFQSNFSLLEDFWKKYGQMIEKRWNRNSNETAQIFEQFFNFVDDVIDYERNEHADEYWRAWCENQEPDYYDDDSDEGSPGNYDHGSNNYLEDEFQQDFPKFYKKWGHFLDFTRDASLEYGTEMKIDSRKEYLDGLKEAFEFLDDFYADFDRQNQWTMQRSTGLHTNVGFPNADTWNPLKGLLFLSYNFANKEWEQRKKNHFTKDLKSRFIEVLKGGRFGTFEKEVAHSKSPRNLIAQVEDELNYVLKMTSKKYFGFNITKIQENDYIEFRFPGGEVAKDALKNAIYYYSYIVKLCIDPEYKKEEYHRRLANFMVGILEDLKSSREKTELQTRKRDFVSKKGKTPKTPLPDWMNK